MPEGLVQLSTQEAVAAFERMPGLRPATLHPQYVVADGRRNPILQSVFLQFREGEERWLHGLHVAEIPGVAGKDATSPYGYGGPVSTSRDPGFLSRAWAACADWMAQAGVVVEYLRFHPLLRNEAGYGGQCVPNRTVVDVALAGDPANGYAPRARATVRKTERSGLRYQEQPLSAVWPRFAAFHREAIRAMGAGEFFVWGDDYFASLADLPGARVGLSLPAAGLGEDWLAAALFLDGGEVREYHLAGASEAGRKLGASSHLLHGAAASAKAHGLAHLYLGGGTDPSPDNPLFFFKSSFSPLRLPYSTGWRVFRPDVYEDLKIKFAETVRAHPHWPIFHRHV